MTIPLGGTTTVRELVGHHPRTRAVFEKYGIDYCCGGGQSLAEAARQRGVELAALTASLAEALDAPPDALKPADVDWYAATLGELVQHILDVHHTYMKAALPRIRTRLSTVMKVHGPRHGALLARVQKLFDALDDELTNHLAKEEQILFPYIVALEGHRRGQAAMPQACFPSARYPIGQMEHEHDSAGAALEQLRAVTGDYTLPADACSTFAALYEELQRMEADLHEHIHLENNILFPRAIALEG